MTSHDAETSGAASTMLSGAQTGVNIALPRRVELARALGNDVARRERAEHHGGHVHREQRHVVRAAWVANGMPPPGQPDGIGEIPPAGHHDQARRPPRREALA